MGLSAWQRDHRSLCTMKQMVTTYLKAQARYQPVIKVWQDYVHGAGLAFDPLPAKRSTTFVASDKAAFAVDLYVLTRDRNLVVVDCKRSHAGQSAATGELKRVHGKAGRVAEKVAG